MFGVLGDINPVAVICHVDGSVGRVNLHFQCAYGKCVWFSIGDGLCLTDNMVAHIHHSFVEQLVKTGDVRDIASGEHRSSSLNRIRSRRRGRHCIHNIFHHFSWLDCSDIGVWFLENMLTVCHFLILGEVGGTSSSISSSNSSRFRRHKLDSCVRDGYSVFRQYV